MEFVLVCCQNTFKSPKVKTNARLLKKNRNIVYVIFRYSLK